MKFRDYFSLKHIIFAIVLLSVMFVFAFIQSDNMVKVEIKEDHVRAYSEKYSLKIPYDEINSIELAELGDPGEKQEDGYDDDVVRYGTWKNDVWGEYSVVADPDTSNCIVVHLTDGRTFVFSCKNDKKTEDIYNQLLPHIIKED